MMLRRANRQIEVFDISLMAVVTKAMGAFLVLMLLLLPYYKGAPPKITSPEEAQRAIAEARHEIAQASQTSGEDAAALKQKLEAAQNALQKAETAIRQLKTELDQVWSQFSRSQQELTDSQKDLAQSQAHQARLEKQLAEAKDTLIIAQRVAAALQAKTKSATTLGATSDRPMAVLDYAMSPGCRDLPLIAADFFAPGDGAASRGELDVVPSAFPLATRWASSDKMLNGMHREFLRLPSGSWTTYITAAIDRLPSTGCDISGQLSATAETIAKAGTRLLTAHATTIDRSFRAKGKLLIAVVERDGKAFIVREPTDSDIATWAKHLGGQAPPQPPGAVVANSPFGPVGSPAGDDGNKPPAPKSVDGNATTARQQEIRKLMEQHLLVRTPQGPTNPITTPAEPKQQR